MYHLPHSLVYEAPLVDMLVHLYKVQLVSLLTTLLSMFYLAVKLIQQLYHCATSETKMKYLLWKKRKNENFIKRLNVWSVRIRILSLHIQFECGKIKTTKNPNKDIFYAVPKGQTTRVKNMHLIQIFVLCLWRHMFKTSSLPFPKETQLFFFIKLSQV